jgi:hypothetical protein
MVDENYGRLYNHKGAKSPMIMMKMIILSVNIMVLCQRKQETIG